MAFDFLRRITERVVRQWKRGELNKKFVELAKDHVASIEKNIQDEKKILELENQVRLLKAEKSRPEFKKKKKIKSVNTDELKDKKESSDKPVKKVAIDNRVTLELDPSELPSDVIKNGTRTVVIKDIKLEKNITEYKIQRYWSPGLNKGFEASIDGYDGSSIGSSLRAFINHLYYAGRVPQDKIRLILDDLGLSLSRASLCGVVNQQPNYLHEELVAARDCGITKDRLIHLDETGHKLGRDNLHTFGSSNRFFTYLRTFASKSRLCAMKSVLINDSFIFDAKAYKRVAKRFKNVMQLTNLRSLIGSAVLSQKSLESLLDRFDFSQRMRSSVLEQALLSAFDRGLQGSRFKHLIVDDAPNLNWWRRTQLCWVHEIRKYKLLDLSSHTSAIDELVEYWRDFYHRLRRYRDNPDEKLKFFLLSRFDSICGLDTGLRSVNEQLARTLKNKQRLLHVLNSPEVVLDNNQIERDLREKVIKRKVSLFNRSWEGVRAWDLMLSLMSTCRKNGVSFYKYLVDRYSDAGEIKYLGQIITSN